MPLLTEDSAYTLVQTAPAEVINAPSMAWGMTLVITSSAPDDYPPGVFVFQVEDFSPNARAWFSTVASPADMLEYPVDAPAAPVEGVQQPYFRKATLNLVSRSPSALEALVAEIKGRIVFLERNLRSLLTLSPP